MKAENTLILNNLYLSIQLKSGKLSETEKKNVILKEL